MRYDIARCPEDALACAKPAVFVAQGRYRNPEAVVQAIECGTAVTLVDPALAEQLTRMDLFPWSRGGQRIVVVPDPKASYARLVEAAAGLPGRDLVVAAVTGTNGKSSVAALLHWVLTEAHRPSGLVGTIYVDTGLRRIPSRLTTPDAAELAGYLREMKAAGRTHAVMEASSHGLSQRRTDGIRVQTAIFTNLGVDHLDYHRHRDQYLAAKRRLFETLRPEATAILNRDDPASAEMARATDASILWYGSGPGTHVRGTWLSHGAASIAGPNWHLAGPLPGLGEYRLHNVLAVLAAASSLGVAPDVAWAAVQSFPGLWRRLEILEAGGPLVVDDCAHNPENLTAAIRAVKERGPARLYVLYAMRGNRGTAISMANAAALAKILHTRDTYLYLTRAVDLATPDDALHPEEEMPYHEALTQAGIPYSCTDTAKGAMEAIQDSMTADDAVLLLGAHAMDHAAELWRVLRASASRSDADAFRVSSVS